MKKNTFVYDLYLIDGFLYILGRANLIEMNFNESTRLSKEKKRSIKVISNVTSFALSPDKKTFAVINTSGYIAVYNYTTGEILLKNKCTNSEGNNQIYYINNHQIICTDYDSKLFVLDIETNHCSVIYDFGVSIYENRCDFVNSIYDISSNEYVIAKGNNELYFVFFDGDNFKMMKKYSFEDVGKIDSMRYINHCAAKKVSKYLVTTRYLETNDGCSFCVLFIDLEKQKTERIINIKKILSLDDEPFLLGAIEVTSDFKKLILGTFDSEIYLIDLESEQMIYYFKKEEMHVSQICSCFDDKKLLVGTWEDLSFIDISELSK